MTLATQRAIKQVTRLSRRERAVVLRTLISSLDDERSTEVEEIGTDELDRRAREMKSGAVKPLTWAQVRGLATRRRHGSR